MTNAIGQTLRRGVASATEETLTLICEENREELARVCGVEAEDVVMTWVSEMQEMVSPDNTSQDSLMSFSKSEEEGKRLSRKKVAKGNQSSLVKIVNNAGFMAQYLPFCSLFTGCCLKPGEVYLKLCQLLEFVSFPQLF